MSEVASNDTVEVLRYLHYKLDAHFRQLHDRRKQMEPAAPVFALEHALGPTDEELLTRSVRSAVAAGLGPRHRAWWLPYLVYAAESGYDYIGDEYWRSFEESTPGWQNDNRHWIKTWYLKFAMEYGGAVPEGSFAKHFTIISWPITHAVLPTYLQRHLAQLLYEFRTGLSSSLLDNPGELGARLAVRARGYTERFQIFCRNTVLLGQVAAALLSGDDETSPYLIGETLDRLVKSVSRERQSRAWLTSARQSASHVRASGFKSSMGSGGSRLQTTQDRLPTPMDPRLFLRYLDGTWNAYAELPDLTPLSSRLPHVYEELRTMRARVVGSARPVPTGALVQGGQEVRFEAWPDPSKPFVRLERGTDPVNALLTDQCVVTRGPWWLFRCQGKGLAVQVKGGFVRPAHRYILVGLGAQAPPDVAWCRTTSINASGVKAYQLDVPKQLTDAEAAALVTHGVSALSSVAVRPVGIVASAWDGEGAAEWLVGEPAMIGIGAELLPTRCLLMVDNVPHFVQWPAGESELVLILEELDVGTHDVTATLYGDADQELSKGSLLVTIRDPQVRPEYATAGEGIRLLASPARPTLAELWDERASVVVDGPPGAEAELTVGLRGSNGDELATVRRMVKLPITEEGWSACAKSIRTDRLFKESYDQAESCVLTVARQGIGHASLRSERGFQPLRWRFSRKHDGAVAATLHDRTDGGHTTVEWYSVDTPLDAATFPPDTPIPLPPRGGLLRATADDAETVVIAPTNPNALFALGPSRPHVPCGVRSPPGVMRFARAHRMWATAELPADPFAAHEQHLVLEAIARANAMTVCGAHWAQLERTMERANDLADYIDDMQNAIGISESHKTLGAQIGRNLYRWLTPETLLPGFAELMVPTIQESGIKEQPSAARFLLTLAGRPGYVTEWEPRDCDYLLRAVMVSPVLLRAARYAVLGTRAINDLETAERGF